MANPTAPSNFTLPVFSNASSSSLMEAVVGRRVSGPGPSGPSPRLAGPPPGHYASSNFSSPVNVTASPLSSYSYESAMPPQPQPAGTAASPNPGANTPAAPTLSAPATAPARLRQQNASTDDDGDESSASVHTGRTESEWDVLSDASSRVNEDRVEELRRKVEKRRSNLPHLTSQLAELEAQIKAAEERLARAQVNPTTATATGSQ